VELNKDDIASVAYQRFNKKHNKQFVIGLLGLVAVLVGGGLGLMHFFPDNKWITLWVGIPVVILALVWIASYNKAQDRAANELIEECEGNSTLSYVSEKEVMPMPH
jgi:putative effector of murein hydrolase